MVPIAFVELNVADAENNGSEHCVYFILASNDGLCEYRREKDSLEDRKVDQRVFTGDKILFDGMMFAFLVRAYASYAQIQKACRLFRIAKFLFEITGMK